MTATVKGMGLAVINSCDLPQEVHEDAAIYNRIREKVVRANCSHVDRECAAHTCAGRITIDDRHMTLRCALCGDARRRLT